MPRFKAKYLFIICISTFIFIHILSYLRFNFWILGTLQKATLPENDFSSLSDLHGGWSRKAIENGLLGTSEFINQNSIITDESDKEIAEISEEINCQNHQQKIYNFEKFGPIKSSTSVLVVQVHSRVQYLNLLIHSLHGVRDIGNCLVIFSHDLYLPELNEAIQKIDFTRVMQIFYPYSIQLNPTRFPGQSPNDCSRDISLAIAREQNCINWKHPDMYGHYREANFTQTKHHWWWKANFIFGRIKVLRNYSGAIAFLEEDHYITPDALWVLNLMEKSMVRNLCHGCNIITLGSYLTISNWNITTAHSKGMVTKWASSKNNMGMSFNRTLWNKIRKCAPAFCTYDDYNWDWSLLPVSTTCLTPLTVLHAEAQRIFHIGDCGMHYKTGKCTPLVQEIDNKINTHKVFLFPRNFGIEVAHNDKAQLHKENGGWGDIRDHKLCILFSTI